MMQGNAAEHSLEQAEAYLWGAILPHERAWPEHYRESAARLIVLLAKMLDPEQVEEVVSATAGAMGASEAFHLRVGFHLGRLWGAFEELTDADVCRAVQAAGGNPGRALAEVVEAELAEVAEA